MKKRIVTLTSILAISFVLTGCSLFSKANGIILYGDEESIVKAVENEKNEFDDEEQFTIKVVENNDESIMILKEETALVLVGKGLIKEVNDHNEIEAVQSLPTLEDGEKRLFAREDSNTIRSGDQDIETNYQGNMIIGDSRALVDQFLIVNDDEWSSFEGTEKVLAIM